MGADQLANLNWGFVGTVMGYGGPGMEWQLQNSQTVHGNESGESSDQYYILLGIELANQFKASW
jgi:hypothetical protein